MKVFLKLVKESSSYDIDAVTHHLEEVLQKNFGGMNQGDFNDDFYFNEEIPINIKSEFVKIKNLRVYCDIVNNRIRFIGCARPTADLLDSSLNEEIDFVDESNEFEESVSLGNKTTDAINRQIDQVVERFVKYKDDALDLWKEMQKSLDKSDELRRKMDLIKSDFEKKLK